MAPGLAPLTWQGMTRAEALRNVGPEVASSSRSATRWRILAAPQRPPDDSSQMACCLPGQFVRCGCDAHLGGSNALVKLCLNRFDEIISADAGPCFPGCAPEASPVGTWKVESGQVNECPTDRMGVGDSCVQH